MKKSACPVKLFQEVQTNVQLYHWLTDSYAKHKASDQLYADLQKSIDRYMEVFIGKYGRPTDVNTSLAVKRMTDQELNAYLKEVVKHLQGCVASCDSDLGSIRDDILANIHQALYLFTLK